MPAPYYTRNLCSVQAKADCWNFEKIDNNLSCGQYILYLFFAFFSKKMIKASFRIGREEFRSLDIRDGVACVPVTVDHRMLRFDLQLPEPADVCPLSAIVLIDPSLGDDEEKIGLRGVRDLKLEKCNLLAGWDRERRAMMAASFPMDELRAMRDEIIDWSASRQVLQKDDSHYGAVYSEEDKYCFVDAIFAAECFMKRFVQTQDEEWLHRAAAARDYCFKGQYLGTGDAGKDGAWASMGIIDDPKGKKFRRITDEWAQASGVDSCLIVIEALRLFEMGLPFSEEQLLQFRASINWQVRNRLAPGWYSHHEGMTINCLNVNSLAASHIFAAHTILEDATGVGVSEEFRHDALRAVEHVFACQQSIGCLPYRCGEAKRGGAYHLHNLPDNGIGNHALMRMLDNSACPLRRGDLRDSLRDRAFWYLFCSRRDDGRLVLEYDASEEYCRHSLAFGNFTWCRITMIEFLSQIWDIVGEERFWRGFVCEHLRTIRQRYWNHTDSSRAPIQSSVVPIQLVSWIQRAEWAAVVFDDVIELMKER